MKVPILFENSHIVVIDKPANIMVHGDGRSDEPSLSDWMKEKYKTKVGDKGREGVVHRLDKNTTGAMIFAKDAVGYTTCKKQFRNHTARKVYRAIVEGYIREDTGMISAPIARARSDFRKKAIVDVFSNDFRGEEREAITRYKVLARCEDKAGNKYSYVEVYPLTGRTHQIRVHFRGIRHPIIGDDLYGSRKGKDKTKRSMLHAYSLTMTIPSDKTGTEEKIFMSPIPKDMRETLKDIGFKEEGKEK